MRLYGAIQKIEPQDDGTVRVHGKGGKIVDMPLYAALAREIEVYLVGRGEDEYFLYPRKDVTRPMSRQAVHNWFKRCLEAAGMSQAVKQHELRHSAADNLWRETGNLMLAKQLLRHESVGTTEAYLHPTYDDLRLALESFYDG